MEAANTRRSGDLVEPGGGDGPATSVSAAEDWRSAVDGVGMREAARIFSPNRDLGFSLLGLHQRPKQDSKKKISAS
jgi:hypothetical protein